MVTGDRASALLFNHYIDHLFRLVDNSFKRISFDPLPISYLYAPDKIRKYNMQHDDIWEYYPKGLEDCINRYWKEFKKPIIITENGACDESDFLRLQAIQDYAVIIHQALQDGIDIRGYYHWSTWDNFEWHLGPSMRFGLYECDPVTKRRLPRPSAMLYKELAHTKSLELAEEEPSEDEEEDMFAWK